MRYEKDMARVLLLASAASMIGQFNLANIRLLLELGCEVHVMCNFKEGNTFGTKQIRQLKRALRELHVVQHQWDCPRNVWELKKLSRAYRQLRRLTGRYTFAWIHCHSPAGGALARMVAHQRGIRVIYTAHGFHFYRGAPLRNWMIYYPAEKLLSKWTDVLITINQEDYLFASERFCAGTVVYIPGVGIDCGSYAAAPDAGVEKRQELGIPTEAFLILSVGELSKRKNHEIVIRSLTRMKNRNIVYGICGIGEKKNKLAGLARKLGVAHRVRFFGYREDLAEIFAASDLFVFPSLQEGLPVALMEAMAAGLAVVCSAVRGNLDLVDEGLGGILCAPADADAYAGAVCMLADDCKKRERMGAYNKKKIRKFDQSVVNPGMREIYQDMCSYWKVRILKGIR